MKDIYRTLHENRGDLRMTIMKTPRSVSALFLLAFIGLLFSCAGAAWKSAARKDTILGYEQFREKHPDSTHTAECRTRLRALNRDPEKVAEKHYTLWRECMEPEAKERNVFQREYEAAKEEKISAAKKAISRIENEVEDGKKKCVISEPVCAEWTEKGGFTPGAASRRVCRKWKSEKRKDFACLNYWEGKEREYGITIAKIKETLQEEIDGLMKTHHEKMDGCKRKYRNACKPHIRKEVFLYYPEVSRLYRGKL